MIKLQGMNLHVHRIARIPRADRSFDLHRRVRRRQWDRTLPPSAAFYQPSFFHFHLPYYSACSVLADHDRPLWSSVALSHWWRAPCRPIMDHNRRPPLAPCLLDRPATQSPLDKEPQIRIRVVAVSCSGDQLYFSSIPVSEPPQAHLGTLGPSWTITGDPLAPCLWLQPQRRSERVEREVSIQGLLPPPPSLSGSHNKLETWFSAPRSPIFYLLPPFPVWVMLGSEL